MTRKINSNNHQSAKKDYLSSRRNPRYCSRWLNPHRPTAASPKYDKEMSDLGEERTQKAEITKTVMMERLSRFCSGE